VSELLQLTDVGRSFGRSAVLAGIDLTVAAGERLAVVGPSGSGKTTLLRLIAGLEPPTTGTVAIAGRPASGPGEVLILPEHRGVALVFQGLALFPHLCALDQVAFAARGRGGIDKARKLLDRVGLGHRGDARLDELSGGERQRVALARALAQGPALLLMDEPFASLDDDRRAEMRDLLRDLIDPTGTALVLVTHSRDDALNLARRVLVLDRGRPVARGPLADVLAHPGHAAAVHALGLGQILQGRPTADDPAVVETAFGRVHMTASAGGDSVHVLVRPGQPGLVDPDAMAIEAEVVAVELRPPETCEPRRIAVVRAGGHVLRILANGRLPVVGDRVHVRIDGECEQVNA